MVVVGRWWGLGWRVSGNNSHKKTAIYSADLQLAGPTCFHRGHREPQNDNLAAWGETVTKIKQGCCRKTFHGG